MDELLMDCRTFRNNHVAYVDDVLCAAEMTAMDGHLAGCVRCARHDTAVRRALLVVHNLPSVEPSPEFLTRLSTRIDALGPISRTDRIGAHSYLPSVGAFAALAAGVAAVTYLAVTTNDYFSAPAAGAPMAVAAAFAGSGRTVTSEAGSVAPLASPAMVASVPTGMPVWPAMLMVGQAPVRFASMELDESNSGR
jgi:hypothetical protein